METATHLPSPSHNGSSAIAAPASPQDHMTQLPTLRSSHCRARAPKGCMRRRDAVVSHHHIRTIAVVRSSSDRFLRKRGSAGCASAGCGSTGHASAGFGLTDRLLSERHSIKGRVGNCGQVFPVAPCVLHRIELLFQWYSHWCAKKNAIEYLPSDALRGRRSAAASLLARMDYSSLCGALSLFACVA